MMADSFICGTPYETMAARARWKRVVREAIKDKGGNVNSIAPEELRKLGDGVCGRASGTSPNIRR